MLCVCAYAFVRFCSFLRHAVGLSAMSFASGESFAGVISTRTVHDVKAGHVGYVRLYKLYLFDVLWCYFRMAGIRPVHQVAY